MAVSQDVRQRIMEAYGPVLGFLLSDPEMSKLLIRATDPTRGYSPTRFQAELYKTKWWRAQSEARRNWAILTRVDPGEAAQRRRLMQQEVAALARQLGIQPTLQELELIRERALRQGLGPDSFYVRNALVGLTRKGGRTDVGAWTTTANQIRELGNSQYLKAMPKHVVRKWTEWVVSGQRTIEDYQAAAQAEAMKRFPHMREQLAQGLTPGDVVAPFRAIIADELELGDQSQVSMTNPVWRQLTGIRDPKTKKMRMMTESEVVRLARSQPQWGRTMAGRQMQSGLVQSLLQTFGKRAT